MAKKLFLVDVDLNNNQLLKSVLQNLTTTEINALSGDDLVSGKIVYDSVNNEPYIYDGTSWRAFGGDLRSIAEATGGGVVITDGGGPNATIAIRVDNSSVYIDSSDGDKLKIKDGGVVSSHIAANNVTLDKLEEIANLKVLGNFSGSTGNVVEVTVETTATDTDSAIPTSGAVLDAIALAITSGMDYKGGYDASTNTPDLDSSPSGVKIGDTYTVTVAGTFFTVDLEVGDMLIAEIDGASAEGDWTIVQRNVDQATETIKGIAQIATTAEAEAGTNDTDIMTPLKVKQTIDNRIVNNALTSIASGTITGDGGTVTFSLTHNFGTKAVVSMVRSVTSDEVVEVFEDLSSINEARFTFNEAPAVGEDYTAIVIGYDANITT